MAPLFPDLDLTRVCLKDHANLLVARNFTAMAFSYRIYFRHTFNQDDPRFLRLMVHELVHAEQVRRLGGEVAFARAYFAGHFAAGYDDNPLEKEARDFVRDNPI